MSSVTEEIEGTYREIDRILPKGEIPFLGYRYICTYQSQNGTNDEQNAG